MKLTKLKLFLGLFLLVLSTTMLVVAPTKVIAANFVDGKGTAGAVNRGDNTRFVFQDPFTITDSGNSTNYTTTSQACGGDNMYVCASGDVMHPGSYWYWPGGQELGSQNGQCVSALVLMVRQTPGGTGLNQARLFAVNAHPTALKNGCYVQDTNGHEIKKADIDGWGAMPVEDDNAASHSASTIVMGSDVTRLDAGNTSDHPMFAALATEFKWANSGEIDSIVDPDFKSLKVTDADLVQQISTALGLDSSSTKPYDSGYDYYIPNQCIDDSQKFKALLAVKQGDPSSVVIIHRQDGDTSKGYLADSWQGDQQSCLYHYNHRNSPNRMWGGGRSEVKIGLADQANAVAAPTATGGGGGSTATGGSDSSDSLDCGAGEWNWLICSGSQLVIKASDGLNTIINGLLSVSTSNIFGSKSDSGYYVAWNSFRVIAIAVIVIAGLVMVTSEALGFEILDAYTIRKTLPRLLIAIIGISVSWPLTQFFIQLFNVLGKDIEELIAAPFASLHQNNTAWVIALANPLTLVTAAGAALFAYGPAILTFGITAFLAALVAVLILVVRQTVIIVLVILAPLAIACYVLPNTQKVWNFWRENFLGMLMVYPIITAFIAAGRVMSAAASSHTDSGVMGAVYAFIAIVAYFLPYFLLPIAFRVATGIIGNLAGFVNDRSKGAFDRLKNVRTNSRAKRAQEFKAGSLTTPGANALGVNALGRRVGVGARGRFGVGQQGHAALATMAGVQAAQALKNDPRLGHFAMGNDDGNAVLALSGGTRAGAEAAAAELFAGDVAHQQRALAAAASVGFSRQNATAALMGLAQNKSRAVGQGRTDIVRNGIDRLAGTNNDLADELVGTFAFNSRQAGRVDLGGMNWGLREQRAAFNQNVEGLAQRYAGGGPVTAQHRQQATADLAMMDGVGRTKVQDVVGGHSANMQQAMDTMNRMLSHGDTGQRQQAATHLFEFQQGLNGASMDNQRIINNGLHQAGVGYDSANGTVAEQLSTTAGMDLADLTRGARTYGEEVPLAARGGAQPQPTPADEDH
jgi:hypothetical protein